MGTSSLDIYDKWATIEVLIRPTLPPAVGQPPLN
jgi:hypothetical protein